MALFVQAFGQDSTKKNMKLWFECRLEHSDYIVVYSMWWTLQQQTSVTGKKGEAVCIVTENVSGQCVPHI